MVFIVAYFGLMVAVSFCETLSSVYLFYYDLHCRHKAEANSNSQPFSLI